MPIINPYHEQVPVLLAIDCIVFGYDGEYLKILLVKRGFEPKKNFWSLMGGFIGPKENLYSAAERILHHCTGLKGVYLEQLKSYGEPDRDPIERTVSVAYYALIDINKYQKQINNSYHAEWFLWNEAPRLIFDHDKMVEKAKKRIRHKAALYPILFELLPEKFTIPQLQNLYEQVYDIKMDNRNFIRKIKSTKLLIKLQEKDKSSSKRGAFFYKIDTERYKSKSDSSLNFIPTPENLLSF